MVTTPDPARDARIAALEQQVFDGLTALKREIGGDREAVIRFLHRLSSALGHMARGAVPGVRIVIPPQA